MNRISFLVSGLWWAAGAGAGLGNLQMALWLQTHAGGYWLEVYCAGALFGCGAFMALVNAIRAAREE